MSSRLLPSSLRGELTCRWVRHHPRETRAPYRRHRHVPAALCRTATLPVVRALPAPRSAEPADPARVSARPAPGKSFAPGQSSWAVAGIVPGTGNTLSIYIAGVCCTVSASLVPSPSSPPAAAAAAARAADNHNEL